MIELIIHTNKYAGNFERQMCAYITGAVGDCGAGRKEAAIARDELTSEQIDDFDGIVTNRRDDHGRERPSQIAINANWFNDGHGNHYRIDDDDIDKQLKARFESIERYKLGIINNMESIIARLNVGEAAQDWTLDKANFEIVSLRNEIEEARQATVILRFKAYYSVGINFEELPSTNMIALIKERAHKYAALNDITIEEFEYIEYVTTGVRKPL